MSLEIIDSADRVAARMQSAIEIAIPGARAEVTPGSPGHFEIHVRSGEFAGKSIVQQQQLVYAAIKDLMQGANAPVHAIDRMRTTAE
jgi:acid stress-induced BolA-like protein IbaG/YrbA